MYWQSLHQNHAQEEALCINCVNNFHSGALAIVLFVALKCLFVVDSSTKMASQTGSPKFQTKTMKGQKNHRSEI